jgi:serine/threonine protein kinase
MRSTPETTLACSPWPFLAPPEAKDEIGRLAGYRVLKLLGKGGMGMVFQAEDPALRRLVALKVMLPDVAAGEQSRERFLREARAAAKLKHDHVVTIYQVSEDRGVPFLAMEFLKGKSLADWLASGKRPTVGETLLIGRQIAKGLAAAHQAGLVHRDIKPANLWLEAPAGRVKILDFGLARTNEREASPMTEQGAVVGTPAFMAPEQARGETVTPRSDLFSLGCVLYRLGTGRPPFTGDTLVAVLSAVLSQSPKNVRELNPELPERLAVLMERLLAKDPTQRPASAQEVQEELAAIGRELNRPATPPVSRRTLSCSIPPQSKRRRPIQRLGSLPRPALRLPWCLPPRESASGRTSPAIARSHRRSQIHSHPR